MLFPNVTLNRSDFLKHVHKICKHFKVDKDIVDYWITHIKGCVDHSFYFYNMIYLTSNSPYLILHEFIHHIAKELRYYTISPFFYILDSVNDCIDFRIYGNRKGKIELNLKGLFSP